MKNFIKNSHLHPIRKHSRLKFIKFAVPGVCSTKLHKGLHLHLQHFGMAKKAMQDKKLALLNTDVNKKIVFICPLQF